MVMMTAVVVAMVVVVAAAVVVVEDPLVSPDLLSASVKSTLQMIPAFKITHAISNTFHGGWEAICIRTGFTF